MGNIRPNHLHICAAYIKNIVGDITWREAAITGKEVTGSVDASATSFESGFEAAGTTAAGQEAAKHFGAKVVLRLC